MADTNSASTLRSFCSEGCVRHELGVNPPLFSFGGLCRLLWRRQVAYQRRGAPVFGFFFPLLSPFFFVTPPAGVNIDAAPPADTGGYEYGPGGGIGGARGLADRSLYSSNFSVCGISISFFPGCSGCYLFGARYTYIVFVRRVPRFSFR